MSANLMYNFFEIDPTERIPHRARKPADRKTLFEYHEKMATALRGRKDEFMQMVSEGSVTGVQVAQPMGSRVWQTRIFSLAGCYTKEEIAAALGIKAEAISSYMANLSMMGEWFIYDGEEKHLKLCTAEEREAWEAAQRTTRKSSSKRTPQEQANATAATLQRKEVQLETQRQRAADVVDRLQTDPEDEDLLDQQKRAEAMAVVLEVDIKWLGQRASALPEPDDGQDDSCDECPSDEGQTEDDSCDEGEDLL